MKPIIFLKKQWMVLLFVCLSTRISYAWNNKNLQVSGYISGASSFFFEDPLYEGQKNGPKHHLSLQPEFFWDINDGSNRINFVPFLSLDNHDDMQTDLRELCWIHFEKKWFAKIGFSKVFWGVAESRHLVDIINQTDFREDMMMDEKLGQPMLNFALTDGRLGNAEVFILPFFRERTFHGRNNRFRGPLRVDADQAEYESDAKEHHVDIALRYSHKIRNLDIGIGYFYGTGREPVYRRGTDDGTKQVLIPRYEIIGQASLDAQITVDEWLWKFETICRSGQGKSFSAVTTGVEYTVFGVLSTSSDLGLILEYNYDDRDEKAPPTFFESDYFFGTRLSCNDDDMSSLLVGFFLDHFTKAILFQTELETNVTEHWKLKINVTGFANTDDDRMLHAIRKDGYASLTVSYYF